MAYNRASEKDNAPEMIERVVYLNRVSKTVKGGRVMKFSALVVVGDGKGTVGYGLGKAAEVSEAILKGIANAKKNLQKVVLAETTIPHEVIGIFGAGKVLLKPAPVGTGVLAGGAVRAVMEAAGISNIRAKCLRSNNPQNVVKATMQGLLSRVDRKRSLASAARASKKSLVKEDTDMAQLKIKLVKSISGRIQKHIATAESLGLRKIGQETIQPDNEQTRGKIAKIGYLLEVTEVE